MPRTRIEPVDLMTVANELEAGAILGILHNAGIEAWTVPSAIQPTGIFGLSTFAPRTIQVRPDDAERAKEALERNREESVDLDWEEVDVGEPQDDLARRIAGLPPLRKPIPVLSMSGGELLMLALAAIVIAVALAVDVMLGIVISATLIGVWAFFKWRAHQRLKALDERRFIPEKMDRPGA